MKHIDYQEFIELYNKGLSDTEIGEKKLYIKARSSALFEYLISPYFCESMKYKIQTVS